ncbi:g101 [Coccomyxa viridis]|uniref:G101 protein n=1 Tax=Coccomyxa viridis TaxID=1274662 RepID=A0ABP1FEX5_9CHLO
MGTCFSTPDHTHSFACAPPATRRTYSGIYEEREVSERLSELATDLSGSKKYTKLHGTFSALDVQEWIINLDLPVIKMRATALEKGLNIILNPILECVEQLLKDGCELGPLVVTWDTAGISHIPRLVEVACGADGELGTLASVREAIAGMLRLPVPLALLEISSLNRLMSIASKIVGRTLSNESQEAALARWKEWQRASNALGLHPQHLAVALSAQSKALMVFMHMAARYGSGRVPFNKVSQSSAFLESLKQARTARILEESAGGMVVYPTFRRRSSSGDDSPHSPSSSRDPALKEAKDRQRFFQGAGQQMVQEYARPGKDEEPQPVGPPALFLRRHNTGRLWFNTGLKKGTKQNWEQQYCWAGWLLGQGFANRASLCIQLPELLFEKLLQGPSFEPTVEALSEFDAEQAADVRGVLGMPAKEYLDLLKAHDLYDERLKPSGQMPKRHFMRWRVKKLIVDEVRWQYEAFCEGFYKAVDRETVKCWRMTAANLAELAAGQQSQSKPQKRRSAAPSPQASAQLSENATELVPTSNEPVVNTLWKASAKGPRQVMIQAQASISSLMHAARDRTFA